MHQYLIIVIGSCPTNYDDAISDVGAHLWQGVIKDSKSMYSSIVRVFVEAPEGIKLINAS